MFVTSYLTLTVQCMLMETYNNLVSRLKKIIWVIGILISTVVSD